MTNYEKRNRVREALAIRNMKQVELCEKTGIKKSSVNNWLAQRWQPKQNALMKMAQVLDVSEMWFRLGELGQQLIKACISGFY